MWDVELGLPRRNDPREGIKRGREGYGPPTPDSPEETGRRIPSFYPAQQEEHNPEGASHLPPCFCSTSSLTEDQPPQTRHRPWAATGPATIHTDAARGAWQGSQSVKRRSPVLQRQVLRTRAE